MRQSSSTRGMRTLRKTDNLRVVQNILGHTDITITDKRRKRRGRRLHDGPPNQASFCRRQPERVPSEEPRPGAECKLTGKQGALLVATACSKPPVGRARWTLELLAG